jgi:tRNA wybutosine-synthesizing protein 4
VDIYNDEGTSVPPQLSVASSFPSSRMCHTITDIGDEGALLVGGRTSPDNALADCWIFHKW